MKTILSNQRGFSIQEALLTSLIVLISLSALLRAYAVGAGKVERSGIKRQALGYLEAEMEKVRFYSHNGNYNLSPLAFNNRQVDLKNRFLGTERVVPAQLSLLISEESQINGLTYQSVISVIHFEFENQSDTLTLQTKVYRNVQ